jgi:FMN-dependent oxidoreductase (nitrilotriacetate monooxygenase family)
MSTTPQQMSLGMNILGFGAHAAAWRQGEAPVDACADIDYYRDIARTSERGCLDAIFLADTPALAGDVAQHPSARLEPTVLLTAIAAATSRIGVIATASTTYNEPFNLARRIASLDHISHGRAAWNAVTNAADAAAQNFGLAGAPLHVDRYARADEFINVTFKLWDSWEEDALVGDRIGGRYADPAKVHTLDFHGQHFTVKGPLNLPRSPQGRPVLVQAGSSEGGKALGSRYADAIFTTQTTLADGQAFYREMKARAQAWGRNPAHLKVMPGLSTVIGSTEAEAHARFDQLNAWHGEHGLLQQVAGRIGIDASELDPDAPLPWARIGEVAAFERGSQGFLEAQLNLARRENLSIRQLSRRILVGHRLMVGTPEQVADTLVEWFLAGAGDGFNIMPDLFPSGVEVFVDHVVPILQRRGLFRREYQGSTLREHLGLPKAVNQYSLPTTPIAARVAR